MLGKWQRPSTSAKSLRIYVGPSKNIGSIRCGRRKLFFSCHRSKSVALQQSSVPKLLVAGPQSLFAMFRRIKIPCDLPLPTHECRIRNPRKSINVQACLQGSKNQKNNPQDPKKKTKEMSANIIKHGLGGKLLFAIASLRKLDFESPARLYFDSELGTKDKIT